MMNLMHKWDDAEISSLCEDVIHPSINSDYTELNNSLSTLRQRCGKRECGCKNYTPFQSLRLLLKLELSETLIDYSFGLSLLNNYNTVGHKANCQAVLEQLIRRSLGDSFSKLRDSFLDQVWTFQGTKNFTIDVIEELMQCHINRVEGEMFAIYEKSLKSLTTSTEAMWEDDQFKKYVFWSSKSAKIFTTISSLLHSCLLKVVSFTNQYERCVQVVKRFIDKVKTECDENKLDFILLYPYEYHSMVSLLDIPPEFYPEAPKNGGSVSRQTVVKLVQHNLMTRPVQTICLLTHFLKWAPYIRQ